MFCLMFKCFVCKRFGAAATSFLRDIYSRIVKKRRKKKTKLCANLIYSVPVTYILNLTHLNKVARNHSIMIVQTHKIEASS